MLALNKRKSFASITSGSMRDIDPSRSITLRNKFVADMTRRFKRVRSAIIRSVAGNDCFGLNSQIKIQQDIPVRQYEFRTSEEKIAAFAIWLQEMIDKEILEIEYYPTPGRTGLWADAYVTSAYQKGLIMARTDLNTLFGISLGAYTAQTLASSLNSPFNLDRVGLIYSRVYTDLKGVTEEMSTQISRTLAQGIAEGVNPFEMAKRMVNRVDNIGITRANLIARTETIRALNSAAISEYEAASRVIGVTLDAQWWTAKDERVCKICAPQHGRVYKTSVALGLIPAHPNCRCAWLPYTDEIGKKGG